MEEVKCEVTFENEWSQPGICIDISAPYEEDYQMRMLENNDIPGIMKITGIGINGKSRYTFHTGGGISMEKRYEKEMIERDVILNFTGQFIEIVENLKNYMLNPGKLYLDPSCIWEKDENYSFCYVPSLQQDLYKAFHEMTEFFVRKLDYRDMEGIYLAYMLHKATLEEEYDLRKIMEEYLNGQREREEERKKEEKEEQKGEQGFSQENIFTVEEVEEDMEPGGGAYKIRSEALQIMEEKKRYGPIQKMMGKIRTGRWGNWKDLITEIDGQDGTGQI